MPNKANNFYNLEHIFVNNLLNLFMINFILFYLWLLMNSHDDDEDSIYIELEENGKKTMDSSAYVRVLKSINIFKTISLHEKLQGHSVVCPGVQLRCS